MRCVRSRKWQGQADRKTGFRPPEHLTLLASLWSRIISLGERVQDLFSLQVAFVINSQQHEIAGALSLARAPFTSMNVSAHAANLCGATPVVWP